MTAVRRLLWTLLLALSIVTPVWAADLPVAAPEGQGFSSERLARIGPVNQERDREGAISRRGGAGRAQGKDRLLRQLRPDRSRERQADDEGCDLPACIP